jgi:hypothetical protein
MEARGERAAGSAGQSQELDELLATGKPHLMIGAALGRTTGAIVDRLSILNTRTARLKRERAVNLPEIPVENQQ